MPSRLDDLHHRRRVLVRLHPGRARRLRLRALCLRRGGVARPRVLQLTSEQFERLK